MDGLVFNIQRFSLDDGPGIRTTVFLKGCPLSCRWCSNPESMKPHPEIMTFDRKCIKCANCIESCPRQAITLDRGLRRIDRSRCDLCLECARVCPSGAIEQVGKRMSVEDVVQEVEKDRLFYANSDGGVTFSGGEPLLQWEFVRDLCQECRARNLHTALDTSGHARWEIMEQVLQHVDLVLFDVKHLDSAMHRQGTGMPNELILQNVRKTATKTRTWLRVPVIPDYNDSDSHIRELAKLGSELKVDKVSLLPYHSWGEQKYERLGKEYALKGVSPHTEAHIRQLQDIVHSRGLPVTVGR